MLACYNLLVQLRPINILQVFLCYNVSADKHNEIDNVMLINVFSMEILNHQGHSFPKGATGFAKVPKDIAFL